jgi:hypothetical protein
MTEDAELPPVSVSVPQILAPRFSAEAQAALSALELDLLSFAERLGYIIHVQAELERATKGKVFTIYHEPIWRVLLDSRDMIVVDLDSWVESIHGAGGFLKSLSTADRSALRLEWPHASASPGEDWMEEEIARLNGASRAKAFERLFPGITGEPVDDDFEALGKRLVKLFRPLWRDRNQHRAHKYDKAIPKTAAMLSPAEVVTYLEHCQQFVADLRFLSSSSSFTSYGYKIKEKKARKARDVVDLILFGDIGWIAEFGFLKVHAEGLEYYWQKRDAYLEQLHAAHDAAGEPDRPFNNRALVFDGLGRPKGGEGGR